MRPEGSTDETMRPVPASPTTSVAAMSSGWFVDPLGRFDGRFFDGTQWTNQVSSDGSAAIDPDWPPAASPSGVVADTDTDTDAGSTAVDTDAADDQVQDSDDEGAIESAQPERRSGGDRRQVDMLVRVDRRRGQRRHGKPPPESPAIGSG